MLVELARRAVGHLREKFDLAATWRGLLEIGRRRGRRFFVAAMLWELVEDIGFPALAIYCGHPWLVPVFLVLHFEPIVYPLFEFTFRTYDRLLGVAPWEPDRAWQSSHRRTAAKVLSHRLVSVVLFWIFLRRVDLGDMVLASYTVGMTLFAFVHDRLWHDSNFGIDPESDRVSLWRIFLKGCTYRCVSVVMMASMFRGFAGQIPPEVWLYQVSTFGLGLLLSLWWARNRAGIEPVRPSEP